MAQPSPLPTKDTLENMSTSSVSGDTDTVFSSLDRDGFPTADAKAQPWKSIEEESDEEWQPASWNVFGRAYKAVLVTVDIILDLGTGKTCLASNE
ncbi:hypothetical protein N0V90_007260 [Kalmusia sp. IMI 367209]|nr:hypothetical protein N0V90_007260 [Kalmusia sp. IMI 367209]